MGISNMVGRGNREQGKLRRLGSNFGAVERIKTIDEKYGHEVFIEITKDDLVGSGRLYPVGARHFAEQAKFVQELAQTIATVNAVPSVAAHISGKAIAKALEENLGWHSYKITDSLFYGQFRSSDLYACLQSDKAYHVKWFGFRIGFFSEYHNIYAIS